MKTKIFILTGLFTFSGLLYADNLCETNQEPTSIQKLASSGTEACKRILSSKACVLHDFSSYEIKPLRPGLSPFWSTEYVGADLAQDLLEQLMKQHPDKVRPSAVGLIDLSIHPEALTGPLASKQKTQNTGPLDEKSHGTFVANIMNGKGPVGSAPLSPITGFANFEKLKGNDLDALFSPLIEASPAVINISMSLEPFPEAKEKLKDLSQSRSQKSILVFSSGNDGTSKPLGSVRKDVDGIVVGSLHPNGFVSASSVSDERVTILAPGDTWALSQVSIPNEGKVAYLPFGGTSGATPLVSGALAKATSVLKGLTLEEAKILLENTAIPTIYSEAQKSPRRNGAGILNDYRMMKVAQRLLEGGWPENRKLLSTDPKKLFDFKQEAQDAYQEAKKLLKSKDCSKLQEGFAGMRKAFLLDPTRKESQDELKALYDKEGLSVESEFVQSLTSGGMAKLVFTILTTDRPHSILPDALGPDDAAPANRYITEFGKENTELQKKFETYLQGSKNKDSEQRQKIYSAAMSLRGSSGVNFIKKAKNDPDPDIRKSMIASILDLFIQENNPLTQEQKTELLKIYADLKSDKDFSVRSIAARNCNALERDCLPIIRPFLQDKNPHVRSAAIGELHGLGKDALPLVKPLEHDSNEEVARLAKQCVELILEKEE